MRVLKGFLKESSQTLASPGENEVQLSVHSVGVEGWSGVRVLKGFLKESAQTLAGPGEIKVQLSVHSVQTSGSTPQEEQNQPHFNTSTQQQRQRLAPRTRFQQCNSLTFPIRLRPVLFYGSCDLSRIGPCFMIAQHAQVIACQSCAQSDMLRQRINTNTHGG